MVIFNLFSKRMSIFRARQVLSFKREEFQKEVCSRELSICILVHLFSRKFVYTGDWPLTLFREVVLFHLEQRSVSRSESRDKEGENSHSANKRLSILNVRMEMRDRTREIERTVECEL